jgi:hypothetical protein
MALAPLIQETGPEEEPPLLHEQLFHLIKPDEVAELLRHLWVWQLDDLVEEVARRHSPQ